MPVQCTCAQCGAAYPALPYEVRAGRRFCSTACRYLAATVDPRTTFWEKVRKSDDCWVWTGKTDVNGYGLLRTTYRPTRWERAHRGAWELAAGEIPDGMIIGHVCDTRPCVRNDDEGWYEVNGLLRARRGHLWLGTQADNMVDMSVKGRSTRTLGAVVVADILATYAPDGKGGMSASALARKHSTSPGVILRVIRTHRPAS